jgi:hypothetical protein
MKTRSLLVTAVLAVTTLAAAAAPTFEISPFFGYRWGGFVKSEDGTDADFDGGVSYGLAFDLTPVRDSDIKLELLWSRQDSGLDLENLGSSSHVDMTVDEFLIGGVFEQTRGKFKYYLSGLLGATLFAPEGLDSQVKFGLSIGGGFKYFLLKNLALRFDIRGYCTIVDSEGAFISTGGTTVAYFGGNSMWQGEVSGGVTVAF